MKINEAEQLLGITKANIRFYEKEGLLTPSRTESGYRDYSDADIARLKQIVILRKLGIPVQQIADILDGALPLQDAIDANIAALQTQIDTLNGALTLSRQIQSENEASLDTGRYWQLLQNQEAQGNQFYAIVDDYLSFVETGYDWFLWPLPGEALRQPWKVALYWIVIASITAGIDSLTGESFFSNLLDRILIFIVGLLIWTAIFIPIYLLSKRNKKAADRIMTVLNIAIPIILVLLVPLIIFLSAIK